MTLDRAVEQATIGALLLRPEAYEDVLEWLEPEDFWGVAEQQTYAAIRELHSRGAAPTPEAVQDQLRRSEVESARLADGPYLIKAMQRCPDGSRAAVYGRMVLELSIRRRVWQGAQRLRQQADGATDSLKLNAVFASLDGVRRGVEALHLRESAAARSHSVAPAVAGELAPLTRFPSYEEGVVERQAIYALTDQPKAITVVSRWLKTNDFSDEECGRLYGELLALYDAKNAIDPLTLAWRAQKVGIEGPVTDGLVEPRPPDEASADPETVARRVLEQSVRAAVIATTDEIQRITDDGRVNTTSAAYARLNALWPQQRRLIKARLAAAE